MLHMTLDDKINVNEGAFILFLHLLPLFKLTHTHKTKISIKKFNEKQKQNK